MKSKVIILVALGLVASSNTHAQGINANRKANVTFTPATEVEVSPELPPDPENPDVEIDPEIDPELGGGALGFNYLINKMDFGTIEIRDGGMRVPMQAEVKRHTNGESLPTYSVVQTRDLRGSGEGWRVNARMSDLVNERNENIKGISVELLDGVMSEGDFTHDNKIVLNPDISTTIMQADVGSTSTRSTLMWLRQINENNPDGKLNQSIQLVVPAATPIREGSYTGTVEWTIATLPTNTN